SIHLPNQFPRGGGISELSRQPFDGAGRVAEAAAITPLPIPAAQLVPGGGELAYQVASQETRGAGDGNSHGAVPRACRIAIYVSPTLVFNPASWPSLVFPTR